MKPAALVLVLVALFLASPVLAAEPAAPAPDLEKHSSYALGMKIGSDLKDKEVKLDADSFVKGLKDGLAGNKPALSDEEMQKALMEFGRQMQARQLDKLKAVAEKNLSEGQAFLKANAGKAGVKTTTSGLQYKALTAGKGAMPKAGDTVMVNYRGRLIDGTVFDDSYQRGQPAVFELEGIIKGWQEALQMMKEGDRWEIYIPSELAFGPQGAGPQIGPNAALVFEVELIKVNPQPDKDAAAEKKAEPAKDAKANKNAKDSKEAKPKK
ncbi:MAG: FKBP-type peptidyl-prolyl cis-trans isomerase [Pseudomonadota bacterium]